MVPEFQAFATGFPITLAHAAASLVLLIGGCALYSALSPYREIQLIRGGNTAAAISFGGLILALAAPLALSLNASASLIEVVLWGVAVIAMQLLACWLIDLLLSGLPQRVRDGDIAAACLLVAAKLSAAIILAAAVAG